MRWHYRDAGLLWPFVPAFAVHVAEEWFAGFTTWVAQVAGRPMSDAGFLAINAAGMVLLVLAIRAAARAESNGWMAVAVAAAALINTVIHVAGALITGSYAPGLLSAVILYVPLGALTMIRAMGQAPAGTVARGVAVAVCLHLLASAAAFASTR